MHITFYLQPEQDLEWQNEPRRRIPVGTWLSSLKLPKLEPRVESRPFESQLKYNDAMNFVKEMKYRRESFNQVQEPLPTILEVPMLRKPLNWSIEQELISQPVERALSDKSSPEPHTIRIIVTDPDGRERIEDIVVPDYKHDPQCTTSNVNGHLQAVTVPLPIQTSKGGENVFSLPPINNAQSGRVLNREPGARAARARPRTKTTRASQLRLAETKRALFKEPKASMMAVPRPEVDAIRQKCGAPPKLPRPPVGVHRAKGERPAARPAAPPPTERRAGQSLPMHAHHANIAPPVLPSDFGVPPPLQGRSKTIAEIKRDHAKQPSSMLEPPSSRRAILGSSLAASLARIPEGFA